MWQEAILTAALLVSPLAEQTTPASAQDSPATSVEDVVVSGRSLRQAVEAFVGEVTNPPPGHGPARWAQRVCVGVVNLRQDAAQVVIERVSEAATVINLDPMGPGCSPNILVIATDDADGLANALVEGQPLAFRPGYAGASQSGRKLDAFRTTSNPVRWWHVSMPVTRGSENPAVRMPGQRAPEIPGGSLLTTEVVNRLRRSFVILDITKMEGATFQQVGDYVAMVALAQVDPDADTSSFDTVMNLFSDPEHVGNLTEWDQAYLRALYGAYLNERNPNAQLGSVENLMVRDRRAIERARPGPESASQD